MTVGTIKSEVFDIGDGVTLVFTFTEKIFDVTHLFVRITDKTTKLTTTQVRGGSATFDYTAVVESDFSKATVTFNTAPTANEDIALQREVPLTQLTAYVKAGAFPAASHERALDLLTMGVQQVNSTFGRGFRFGPAVGDVGNVEITESVADRKEKALVFDSIGDLVLGTLVPLTVLPVSETDSSIVKDKLTSNFIAANAIQERKNLIINGAMDITQRGITFPSTPDNAYTLDRWQWNNQGAGVVTVSRDIDDPDPDTTFRGALKIVIDTISGALGATDAYHLRQTIEGNYIGQLAWGATKVGRKSITVSFWVRSPKAGIHSLVIRNSPSTVSYVAEYTVNVADTFEFKIITIPGAPIGGWLNGPFAGMKVDWTLASGSNFITSTPNTWETANNIMSANSVTLMDVATKEFRLGGVQLEQGTVATPYERLAIEEIIDQCQRYYEKSYDLGVDPATSTVIGHQIAFSDDALNRIRSYLTFSTRKRAIPTVAHYSDTGVINQVTINGSTHEAISGGSVMSDVGERGCTNDFSCTTAGVKCAWHWTADAEFI